jgi:lactam utilization protein B
MRIDINSDTGESFGAYTIGHDAGLFKSITSANVAAGFHAGDPSVLRDTIRLAKKHGVAVGAHPGFPDLVGFGRRELNVTPKEAEDLVLYQVAAVAGVAAAEGVALQHVKPHGALFNMAVRNRELSDAIARGVAAFDKRLILFGLPWLRNPQRGARRGLEGRCGGVRRSGVRTRRFARIAPEAWIRHPRPGGRGGARRADGPGAERDRDRRLGGDARGRYDVRPRGHARL